MAKIEFIGNLGADAQLQTVNGRQFVSFNVADTEVYTDSQGQRQERTSWISCTMAGDGGNLMQYLVKGKTVYVRGYMSTRVFNSAKHHMMMAGVNCRVLEIELIGGQTRDIPRQLNDSDGVLYDIYQAFYIDPAKVVQGKQLVLFDRNMLQYAVDNNGFVTKVNLSSNASNDNSRQSSDANNENDAPVF